MRMIAMTTPRYLCVGSFLLVSACLILGSSATSAGDDATKADAAEQSIEIPSVAYVTLMLARDPAVQSELKLQRKQIDELSAAVAEVDQPMWVLRDVPIAKSAPELDVLLAKLQKQLNRILTTAQRDRLNEIILQARGYKALVSPDVSQRLKLSDKQIEQLRQALSQAKSDDTTLSKKVLGHTVVRAANRVVDHGRTAIRLESRASHPLHCTRTARGQLVDQFHAADPGRPPWKSCGGAFLGVRMHQLRS